MSNSQSSLALLSEFVSTVRSTSSMTVGSIFPLNCCQRRGNNLQCIIQELSKFCSEIRHRNNKKVSLFSNFLYSILDASANKILTLAEVKLLCKEARQKGIPLPDDITPLLANLHYSGLIIYLESKDIDPSCSWIVVHKERLLSEVDGTLFAPMDPQFPIHPRIASNTVTGYC